MEIWFDRLNARRPLSALPASKSIPFGIRGLKNRAIEATSATIQNPSTKSAATRRFVCDVASDGAALSPANIHRDEAPTPTSPNSTPGRAFISPTI
jgi:hypothetical protein